ncbi:MAG TPA: lysine--tRNA ligase, partial [Candidatus Polarisedimenticolia bacterium]|nr:lysine--tRNA ligase [Candidatus Polarisedimenticolia bacterium]
ADEIAGEILKANPGPHEISTGISPSGEIHIGNLREVITADCVYRALRERGAKVVLNYVADNFDPLRKVYPFLDASVYEKQIGKPLSEFACPCSRHASYADHFLEPFLRSLERMGIEVKVYYADRMYKSGLLVPQILQALKGRDAIARILQECTGRKVEPEWNPFNPICQSCGKMTETLVTGYSEKAETVDYTCACGGRGSVSMRGGGKLTWRADWPARWARIPVTIEPFGKDHATRGGSYDTGARICREVYKAPPPFPVTYEWISFKGKGELKKSKGNILSVHRMLEVVPPEVLRYLVVKTRPMRSIAFDPGLPLLSLVDEFDDAASQERDPRALALSGGDRFTPVGVPFRHLVNVVQMADFDLDQTVVILRRNGYPVQNVEALKERAGYAVRWLREFAPEEVKFSVQRDLPPQASDLDAGQRRFLARLAEALRPGMTGEEIHALVYEIAKEAGLEKATAAFEAIYRAFLGRTKGPRAGWFLAFLERGFVVARLKAAGGA